MPVVLGSELDQTTLDLDDFEVRRASGEIGTLACVTLEPSTDRGELRTVLLIGEFGSPEDPPVAVSVVGELLALDGSRDLIGSTVDVVPLPDGPSLVLASVLTPEERAARAMTEPTGSCLGDPENTVLRVAWDGGVSLPAGEDISETDLDLYEVTVADGEGRASSVTPIGFADANDSDNNHELCLATASRPVAVSATAGRLVDPGGDLNPTTSVDVSL